MSHLQTCPNCRRAMQGGRFNACPACGYDPARQEPQVSRPASAAVSPNAVAQVVPSSTQTANNSKTMLGERFELKHALFRFDGRINRFAFNIIYMSLIVSTFITAFVAVYTTGVSPKDRSIIYAVWSIAAAAILLSLYCGLSLTIKRLHDLDMSGIHTIWIYFIGVLPIAMANSTSGVASPFFNLIQIGIFLWLMCARGTNGPNRYGPPKVTFPPVSSSP